MSRSAALIGGALAAYVRRSARRVEPIGADTAMASLRAVRAAYPGRKIVLFYWIEDILPMMVIDRQQDARAGWSRDIEFICDDTYGGRVTECLLQSLGRRTLFLHRTKPVQRIRDLQAIVRSKAPMGITVDGGGPYGRVGAAFARLLDRTGAIAVPMSAVAARAWHVRLRAILSVPHPRTAVALTIGEPITEIGADDAGIARLQDALERVRAASNAALACFAEGGR